MARITKSWNGPQLTVSLKDDETVLDSFTFNRDAGSIELVEKAAEFGFGTKIGNFGALPAGTPERERFEAMKKGAEQLLSTGWKVAREAGEDGADSELELLAKAAAQVTGMSAEEAYAYVKAAKPAERTALRKDREVATALAALRPETTAKPSLLEQMRNRQAPAAPATEAGEVAEQPAKSRGKKSKEGGEAQG